MDFSFLADEFLFYEEWFQTPTDAPREKKFKYTRISLHIFCLTFNSLCSLAEVSYSCALNLFHFWFFRILFLQWPYTKCLTDFFLLFYNMHVKMLYCLHLVNTLSIFVSPLHFCDPFRSKTTWKNRLISLSLHLFFSHIFIEFTPIRLLLQLT